MVNSDSVYDFFGKIEREGGDYAALDYGLKSDTYDIPVDMAEKWNVIREKFGQLEALLEDFTDTYKPADYPE